MTTSLNRFVPIAVLAVTIASGCASHRLDLEDRPIAAGIDTPGAATTPDAIGNRVVWGGRVVAALGPDAGGQAGAGTYLVAAAPLDAALRPARNVADEGLYLVRHDGEVLEPGRFITTLGRLASVEHYPAAGSVGTREVVVPMLDVEQYRLWPVAGSGPSHDGSWGFGKGYVETPGNTIQRASRFNDIPTSARVNR